MKRVAAACALSLAALTVPGAHAQAGSAIEMGELRPLDLWSVSAITPEKGALPPTLWAGASPMQLGALFDRLPAAPASPVAFDLARRALTSSGDAPQGEGAAEAAPKRFAALGRMGLADDLAILAASAGAAANDPAVAQFVAQADLARGDITAACRRAYASAAGAAQPAFILRLRALCAATASEWTSADLALEVARTAGGGDAWFESVIRHMSAPARRPPAARFDNSLNASASLAAGLRATGNPLTNASSLALLTVARSDRADATLRAQAAALAFRRGVLDAQSARALIRMAPAQDGVTPALTATLATVEAGPGTAEAGAALAALLRGATAYADFAAASSLFHDDIALLTQAPDAASVLLFWRAALASGDSALAQRMALAAQASGAAPQSTISLRLATTLLRGDLRSAAPTSARDAAILRSLGAAVDPLLFTPTNPAPPITGRRPDAATLAALQAAAASGAIGETALNASILLADGASLLDTAGICDIIAALRAVGLEDAARHAAVEALIGGAT